MSRPRTYTVAAVLLALSCLLGLLFEIPNLTRGATPAADAPPFALTIVNFTVAILSAVAAYGVWRAQKWGAVLGIILCAISILTSLPAIVFAPSLAFRLFGGVSVAWFAAIIALLVRPLRAVQQPGRTSNARGGQPTTAGSD